MSGLRTKHVLPEGVVIPKPPPRKLQRLDDLSEPQQRALIRAASQGILPGENGVAKATLASLELRGLIHLRTSKKGRTSWRPTDTGRGLVAAHIPTFLHRHPHRNYTHDARFALRSEQEVMESAA